MNSDLIIKYLSGRASDTEINDLFEWVELSESNLCEFAEIKNAWALSALDDKFKNQEDIVHFDTILEKIQRKQKYKGKIRHISRQTLKIAASIFISILITLLSSYIIWHKNEPEILNEISVPSGQQSQLTLSDGTKIWLNARSRLTFPSNFSKDYRTVKLEGEGYFEVEHNDKKPFIVEVKNLKIKVLGTKFNVSSYNDDNEALITLVNGSVSLLSKIGKKELARLKPGEMAVYGNTNHKLGITNISDTELYTSWHYGQFKFRKLSFEKISKRLERNFNVIFKFDNQQLKNTTYNGSFYKYESLENILKIMQTNTQFFYQIRNDTIYIK